MTGNTESESPRESPTPPKDNSAALQQTLSLLRVKDDTSRFVGLSLLRTLLDTDHRLSNDSDVISRCWHAIPAKFILRLLYAKPTDKRSQEEADQMIALAISIIHAFSTLLANEELGEEKMIQLAPSLVEKLDTASQRVEELILRTLLRVGQTNQGERAILDASRKVEDYLCALVGAAFESDLNMEALKMVLVIRLKLGMEEDEVMQQLLSTANKGKSPKAFDLIAAVLEESQYSDKPPWLPFLLKTVQTTFLTSPNLFNSTSRILHHFISTIPRLDPFFPPSTSKSPFSEIPFSYRFISMVLIDIRSTIPMLMEKLASSDYGSIALGLAKSYDLLNAFVGVLMDLDSEDDDLSSSSEQHILDIPVDLLLKLRKEIAETLSLTIEFLRDRWDAARFGAAGLHPDVLPNPSNTQVSGQPRQLTWESPSISLESDPVVVAGSRVLSLWLHEDDNESLRMETIGIIDILLELYSSSIPKSAPEMSQTGQAPEYRDHIALALEALVERSEGVTAFLQYSGWGILASDLKLCIGTDPYPARISTVLHSLTTIIQCPETTQTKELQLSLIPILASFSFEVGYGQEAVLAAVNLVLEMLDKAPKKLKERYRRQVEHLIEKIDVELSGKLEGGVREEVEGRRDRLKMLAQEMNG